MHAVSGALSLPSRGAFHLSLAVLCTIGHLLVFSLGGWSPRLRTGFHVSRPTLRWAPLAWIATGLSPAVGGLSIPLRSPSKVRWSSGLLPVRSPLLRESRLISFPPGTEMFQFPGFASSRLCIHRVDTLPGSPPLDYVFIEWIRLRVGFPIRNHGSQRPFASRTVLSGLGPSFVAGRCLGIPRVHSFA